MKLVFFALVIFIVIYNVNMSNCFEFDIKQAEYDYIHVLALITNNKNRIIIEKII